MKKVLIFIFITFLAIGLSDAAVRDDNTINRDKTDSENVNTVVRSATNKSIKNKNIRNVSGKEKQNISKVSSRSGVVTSNKNISNRAAVSKESISPRTAKTTVARSAITNQRKLTTNIVKPVLSRAAALSPSDTTPQSFGTGYNSCRDSYFTCMDQFCANANETYRRCVCSSRLEEIKTKERALSQTAGQLEDFKNLNIEVITKTGAEVKAMLNETSGEAAAANTKDKSDSSKQLSGISAVLNKTKSDSTNKSQNDIAGDINTIWSTTDVAAGADIMNLTGEKLYNTVHSQCLEFATTACESKTTLNMVVSAYGMYIENDCTNLSNDLGKKITAANGTIRETEQVMNTTRLENYNNHNSTGINDCIANVRKDITADTACGENYVHCLDVTGQYLTKDTGEPIYTPNFYQLELQSSLDGDVLKNQANRLLVAELQNKKEVAAKNLDKCSDLSAEVWDEFMRQAIAEIYQGQQTRIKKVKNECIDVVNDCYDTKSKSLKDFSNVKEQLLLGARLELSEEMCKTKLDACSNLYGGGTDGLTELVSTMGQITDQKIAKNCQVTLEEYAAEICAVPSNDTVHAYPFSCRIYAPGDQQYAQIAECNISSSTKTSDSGSSSGGGTTPPSASTINTIYNCPSNVIYQSCKPGYYLSWQNAYNATPTPGNTCAACTPGYTCAGGTAGPSFSTVSDPNAVYCGDYNNSLYRKLVKYAMQACVRPSKSDESIPTGILQDVNVVMDKIKVSMGTQLSNECERLGGVWVSTPGIIVSYNGTTYTETELTGNIFFTDFYNQTSSNKKWGYCSNPPTQ